ncbi:MAG: NYN domain-containing protein [Bacillota bacterium]|nr:NYN domain-containing protein [Bacillota bacterium]
MDDTKRFEEKRYAVLIDADNVSAKYIKYILEEISNYGLITYKRIYGDWTKKSTSTWKTTLLENSVSPIQQYAYTTGKNATDSAMIIDAMDILYSGKVDGFCLVSSDSDFTRLASRLRESGMTVIGMGEKKTPRAFSVACNYFKYLDILYENDNQVAQSEVDINIGDIEESIKKIIAEYGDEYGGINIGELGSRLVKRHPDFDVRNFGYTKLSSMLERLKSISLKRTDSAIMVNLNQAKLDQNSIQQAIVEFVKNSKEQEMNLAQLSQKTSEMFPNFDCRTYGYTKFFKFINDISELKVKSRGKNGCIKTVVLSK